MMIKRLRNVEETARRYSSDSYSLDRGGRSADLDPRDLWKVY